MMKFTATIIPFHKFNEFWILVGLVFMSGLTGCSQIAGTTPTVMPTMSISDLSTATISPSAEMCVTVNVVTATVTPHTTAPLVTTPSPTVPMTPVPTVVVTPITIFDKGAHLVMDIEGSVSDVLIDSNYIYYMKHSQRNNLYRVSLNGKKQDLVVTSEYERGVLAVMQPFITGNWLIVVDSSDDSLASDEWQLKAFDLNTMKAKVLMKVQRSELPMVRGEGDILAFTYNRYTNDVDCTENVFGVINILTEEKKYLDQGCAENRHMWVFAKASGDYVVADRYLPNTPYKGRASSDIFLINWRTGERMQLTDNGRSSMPAISGHWVAWKSSPRFTVGQTMIYDIETGSRYKLIRPDYGHRMWREPGFRAPLLAGDRWLYWPVGEPVLVFDLETRTFLGVAPPPSLDSEYGRYGDRFIFNDRIVWSSLTSLMPIQSKIKWRELPKLKE